MHVGGVVEIAPASTGDLPGMLIAAAYRASRSAMIMLVLRATTRRAVDRVLDPVVRVEGIDVQGLMYVDAEDQTVVLRAARDAAVVVASTPAFRNLLSANGIPWSAPDAAPARLLGLIAPRPAASNARPAVLAGERADLLA